jgi:hypothetical protein
MRALRWVVIFVAMLRATATCLAEFSVELLPAEISEAARNDHASGVDLTDAQAWHLQATTDLPVLLIDLHLFPLAGSVFHHPLRQTQTGLKIDQVGVTGPPLTGLFPALTADTYVNLPSSSGIIDDDDWIAGDPREIHHHFYSTIQESALSDFTAAQITMLSEGGSIDFRLYVDFYLSGADDSVVKQSFYYPPTFSGPLAADANLDFRVDAQDLEILRSQFGATGEAVTLNQADVDDDGDVDLFDGAMILKHFPGPGTAAQGDVNGDGNVDINDLKIFQFNNNGLKWNRADLDEDLDVDGDDFLLLQRGMGNGFVDEATSPNAANVPEPAAVSILAAGALLLVRRRHTRQSARDL